MAENGALELSELLAGLDPELLDQRLASGSVGLQRLGLAPGTVERQHAQSPQPLAQRMLRDQGVELGRDLVLAAAVQVGLDAVLDCGETQCIQPGSDRCDPRQIGQV